MKIANEVMNEVAGIVEITDLAALVAVSGGGDPWIPIRPQQNAARSTDGDPWIPVKPN